MAVLDNPVPWPHGARCAAAISFDMDTDSALHLSHADAYKRVGVLSWLRYDEVAVSHRRGVRSTAYMGRFLFRRGVSNGIRTRSRRLSRAATRSPITAICTRAPETRTAMGNSTGCNAASG